MKVKLVKIGHSIGVRLPKSVLDECGFRTEADLSVRQKTVVLKPVAAVRAQWRQKMKEDIDQRPIIRQGEWIW